MDHKFELNSTVTVYNKTIFGKPIIEGQAKIVGFTKIEDQYKVRFNYEKQTVKRFVYPGECQSDPTGYIAKAQKEWDLASHGI